MKQLYTKWGESLDKNNILKEYPRPQLVRDSYFNLNGEWDYVISKNKLSEEMDGKILVPFSPESILSGVNRFLEPDEYLIYTKEVSLPKGFIKDRLLLHFGAVDQEAEVYVNDVLAITHLGGFTPFSVDITELINSEEFDLKVIVRDISDSGCRQTGKQRIKRGGIFYTPQSGIWQTVWLESVEKDFINDITIVPDFDNSRTLINIKTNENLDLQEFNTVLSYNGKLIGSKVFNEKNFSIEIPNFLPWTPESPNLYDLDITYKNDKISTYFGMRKFERKADSKGIMRFYLNDKPYLLSGVLDQGYYPDGLLTNPSDEALYNDIKSMKEMGFNLLRKHIKIEPLRWYYHCDKIGMIVWQDMINGSERKDIFFHGALAMLNIHINDKRHWLFGRRNKKGREQYMLELNEMISHLKNITCISTWVPFNEAWGQFDSLDVSKHIRDIDKTRLIDHASGWSDQGGTDFRSEHIYFKKVKFNEKYAKKRILALTEFGGYSLLVNENSFNPDKVFGYKKYQNQQDLEAGIKQLYENQIIPEVRKGLNVLIYTQLSDVEDEVNGFLTYDRKVAKVDVELIRQINKKLFDAFNSNQ